MSTFALSIDRTSLSLAALAIPTADQYYLGPGFGPGDLEWDRKVAESDWVHGRILTHARKQQTELAGAILVVADLAASATTFQSRIGALYEALSQLSYTVTFTQTQSTTATYTWVCEPADITPGDGGAFVDHELDALMQVFQVRIPRSPVPVAGPI